MLAVLLALGATQSHSKEKPAAAGPITSVQVEPLRISLRGKWAAQALLVMGKRTDGSVQDVTARAQFKSLNTKIATVSKAGLIKPVADGVTTVSVFVPGQAGKQRINVSVVVEDSRGTAASFLNQVQPTLGKLGCNSTACHGAKRGKGGLMLSLFGGDPQSDFEALTKAVRGRRINRVEPMKSLLFQKAVGAAEHPGPKLTAGTPEYEILVSWLLRGAPWIDANEAQLVSLKVSPAARVLKKGESQQLLVSAVYSDGFERDVTHDSVYHSSEPKTVSVSADGKATAADLGESVVVVNYMRKAAVARWRFRSRSPRHSPN